jgi:H+/Cl- antiporter ClcA
MASDSETQPLTGASHTAYNGNGNEHDVESLKQGNGSCSDVEVEKKTPLFAQESHLLPEATEQRRVFVRQHTGFWDDARHMREGTIPQSMVVALVVGIVCGAAACLYYNCLEYFLDFFWKVLPEKLVVGHWDPKYYVLWIPLVGFSMAILVGLSVLVMGEPGDLAYTIQCVHKDAFISMGHVMPMVAASQFSILGGGSLGPEAPLVAICAALGGFVSRYVFKQTKKNIIRKHTLMGMAAALAAFFGCPLGGSLFALEVNSRFGVEYFEHVMESIFAGEVCLAVFRALAKLPIKPIWTFDQILTEADPMSVVHGAVIGLLGAGVAALFSKFHWIVMDGFNALGWLDNKYAIQRALLGSVVIVGLGMAIPQTLFWGEFEFQTISSMEPASTLANTFPTSGLFGFEMNSFGTCLVVAFAKLVAISFTVAGGYRGGFIFPFFATGAALGRALCFVVPSISPAVACLCFAAGINVAITRTALATSCILVYLSGEPNCMSPILAASLVSLFATSYMPFIKTQVARADIEHSIFHMDCITEEEEETSEDDNSASGTTEEETT